MRYLRNFIRREDTLHLCFLLVILLIGVGVRLCFLSAPLHQDEARTFVNHASKPLSAALSEYSSPNNHLFHTLLVHAAYSIFGQKLWAIRLPALCAGILLIPVSYFVFRMLYHAEAALFTAALAASSAPLIRYSVLARGYGLICLFFLLALGSAAYLMKHKDTNAWLFLGICAALGFYTMPIMVFPFGITLVWCALSIVRGEEGMERGPALRNLARALMVCGLLTGVAYLPVVVVSGVKSVTAHEFLGRRTWADFFSSHLSLIQWVWNDWNRHVPAGARFLLVIGFFASLAFHKNLSTYRAPIALAVPLWLIPLLAFTRVYFPVRVWLFLLVLYLATASSGLGYLLDRCNARLGRYRTAITAVLATGLCVWLSLNVVRVPSIYAPFDTERDAEKVTVFLKDYLRPGDLVIAPGIADPGWDQLLNYYFMLHDVPTHYFTSDIELSTRLIIVEGQFRPGLDRVREKLLAPLDDRFHYSEPRLVKKYPHAAIHEVHRVEVRDASR